VSIYNPTTDKYIETSVHINRIKLCYQRDDIPKNDEVIEHIPIVEVTYPRMNQAPATSTTSQHPNEAQSPVHETENMTQKTIPTTSGTDALQTAKDPSISKDESTRPQQGSIPSDDHIKSDQYWNTLKIVRQNTGKEKPRFLIRWEDPTAPDSRCNSIDVNDELKRVFYLTHTKTGSKRVNPLEDTENSTLAVIMELDESMLH